jgi:hypothetical protein
VKYQQFGRYGFLVLIALLYFGSGVLSAWMSPAMRVRTALLTTVGPLIHPSVRRWSE